MFRKTFCPDKGLCFLAGKSKIHDVAMSVLFATIFQYSPPFTTIRYYSFYSLFATIRSSGFPDTRETRRKQISAFRIDGTKKSGVIAGLDRSTIFDPLRALHLGATFWVSPLQSILKLKCI